MFVNCLGNFPDRYNHLDENFFERNLFEIFFFFLKILASRLFRARFFLLSIRRLRDGEIDGWKKIIKSS